MKVDLERMQEQTDRFCAVVDAVEKKMVKAIETQKIKKADLAKALEACGK